MFVTWWAFGFAGFVYVEQRRWKLEADIICFGLLAGAAMGPFTLLIGLLVHRMTQSRYDDLLKTGWKK